MSRGLKKSSSLRTRCFDAGAAVAGLRGEERRFRIGDEMRQGFSKMIFPRSRLRLDRKSGECDNKQTADGSIMTDSEVGVRRSLYRLRASSKLQR